MRVRLAVVECWMSLPALHPSKAIPKQLTCANIEHAQTRVYLVLLYPYFSALFGVTDYPVFEEAISPAFED
jgi:hypothetical protein